ncbi:Molybdopterin biosynthesis MoeB protein [Giardia lamblia P15]|uniref:Molybdopterin biosynthesis MoeB protein n=1 Tax=Giardia intestinalis (strain P15) TaxID=658858 RepID=E1F8J1_GIAIA|nr:Molybdopterin biosynthesis MoeB protein [Giardia lamblia P15]
MNSTTDASEPAVKRDTSTTAYAPEDIFQRFILCKGKDAFSALQKAVVMVVGVGAVGGFAAEMLARCGVGTIILIDKDVVEVSNINRQIVATTQTIGEYKVDIMKERIERINPYCKVTVYREKIGGEEMKVYAAQHKPDIVIDAIDLFIQKCEIIAHCLTNNIPIVSSMGAARKRDPGQIRLDLVWNTTVCPLARKVRNKLFDMNIRSGNVVCVYTTETPVEHPKDNEGYKLSLPSFSIITTMFGVWAAYAAISYLISKEFPIKQ